jgi:hypothetical protein
LIMAQVHALATRGPISSKALPNIPTRGEFWTKRAENLVAALDPANRRRFDEGIATLEEKHSRAQQEFADRPQDPDVYGLGPKTRTIFYGARMDWLSEKQFAPAVEALQATWEAALATAGFDLPQVRGMAPTDNCGQVFKSTEYLRSKDGHNVFVNVQL